MLKHLPDSQKTKSQNWLLKCSHSLHVTHCDHVEVIHSENKTTNLTPSRRRRGEISVCSTEQNRESVSSVACCLRPSACLSHSSLCVECLLKTYFCDSAVCVAQETNNTATGCSIAANPPRPLFLELHNDNIGKNKPAGVQPRTKSSPRSHLRFAVREFFEQMHRGRRSIFGCPSEASSRNELCIRKPLHNQVNPKSTCSLPEAWR